MKLGNKVYTIPQHTNFNLGFDILETIKRIEPSMINDKDGKINILWGTSNTFADIGKCVLDASYQHPKFVVYNVKIDDTEYTIVETARSCPMVSIWNESLLGLYYIRRSKMLKSATMQEALMYDKLLYNSDTYVRSDKILTPDPNGGLCVYREIIDLD